MSETIWMIIVVVLKSKKPNEYGEYYLGCKGSEEDAQMMRNTVAGKGFVAEGRRFFPDEIETVTYKEHQEHKETKSNE